MGGAAIDELIPDAAQQWTAMGMVGAVLLWLMHRVTKSCDRMADAQSATATALAMLTQRETDAQHATEQKRIELGNKIDRLADHIQQLKAS